MLRSFPDSDLSCCYPIQQSEVWKPAKSAKNSAIFTRSPVRPPNLESLPSPCDYILQTWLLPRGRNAASYVWVGFRCQFSQRLNLYLGLNMQAVGQKPHPSLMLLPPRGVRRTGLSFPFILLLIPWLLTPLRSGLQAFGGSLAFTVWLAVSSHPAWLYGSAKLFKG